jgi:hypothetical protein
VTDFLNRLHLAASLRADLPRLIVMAREPNDEVILATVVRRLGL